MNAHQMLPFDWSFQVFWNMATVTYVLWLIKEQGHELSPVNLLIPQMSAAVMIGALTLCILGNFSCFCCRQLTFFRMNFFEKFFQEHYQSQF